MDLLRHTNLRILATFHSKQLFKKLKMGPTSYPHIVIKEVFFIQNLFLARVWIGLHVTIVISHHNVRLTLNLGRYKLRLWIAACLKEKITHTQTHLIQEYNKNCTCMCRPSNNRTLKTLCFSSLLCMYLLFSWSVGF